MNEPRPRVRVTADATTASTGLPRATAATRGIALPGSRADEAEDAYVRSLIRAQLRLALVTVAGFIAVAVLLAVALAAVPALDGITVGAVPVSWLVHGVAFYPVIIVFATLYRRSARRNERRYRELREGE